MKVQTVVLTLIILSAISVPVFAQSAQEAEEKFSVEASVGYNYVPGFLLGLDNSITKHPDGLSGLYKDTNFSFPLGGHWSLGFSLFDVNSTGEGQWERTDTKEQFRKGGVDGIITGETSMRNTGFTMNFKKAFRTDKKLQTYLKFGVGLGWLNVKFDGKFVGHETESGMDLPVVEDASDRVKHDLFLVTMEGGVRYKLGRHILIYAAPYWNTGFGSKFGAAVVF